MPEMRIGEIIQPSGNNCSAEQVEATIPRRVANVAMRTGDVIEPCVIHEVNKGQELIEALELADFVQRSVGQVPQEKKPKPIFGIVSR